DRVPCSLEFYCYRLHIVAGSTLFPYTTLFRSEGIGAARAGVGERKLPVAGLGRATGQVERQPGGRIVGLHQAHLPLDRARGGIRSEEHTSELQSRGHVVCRVLLEDNMLRRVVE